MQYKTINGQQLPMMTLGTVQLGMRYGINNKVGQPSMESSFSLLSSALENGVNALDTSRDYGTSEDVLGAFIRTLDTPPFVVTKFNIHGAYGTEDQSIEREIDECFAASLEHLGMDKIGCYLLHNGKEIFKYEQPIMRVLRRILDSGKAQMAGMSVYTKQEIDRFLALDDLSAIQVPMSIFDQRLIAGGYIERLAAAGKTVFVRSVFLQGLCFMDPNNIAIPELEPYIKPYLLKLQEYALIEGMSIGQLCVSYIRDIPGVTSLVLGAETREQVQQNVALIDGPPLSNDIRSKISAEFSSFPFDPVMAVLANHYGK